MTSAVLQVSRARTFINEFNTIEEALIDAIRDKKISKRNEMRLSHLVDLIKFCDRDEEEIYFANIIIDEIKSGKKLSSKDIAKINEILFECKNDLILYMNKMFSRERLLETHDQEEINRYFTALDYYISKDVITNKEIKKRETKKLIYKYPGLYIKNLAYLLQKKFGKPGLTYESVWNYVNELARENGILTIGGPQGRFRYCFPNPKYIEDRTQYYNKFFGISGVIEKKVTKDFEVIEFQTKYMDFYVVNSNINPILLAVDFNAPIQVDSSRTLIKSYGDLEPSSYLIEKQGYRPKNGLSDLDVLFARKVAKVEDSKEEEIWVDLERVYLEPPIFEYDEY